MALFQVSVLKQQKWEQIRAMLGPTGGLRCFDLGADNGILSYLLRRHGGSWASADLEEAAVASIRSLVGTDVHQLDGARCPFRDGEFDRVVIIDLLEHLEDDRAFIRELHRVMKPDGELIVNVPHVKDSWLRRFRLWIGQTDAEHGHVRSGYTLESLRQVLGRDFTVLESRTYSKCFTETVDTLITWAARSMQRKSPAAPRKGTVVTADDLQRHRKLFLVYRVIYPVMWLMSRLDRLLEWRSGYMLIARARRALQKADTVSAAAGRAAYAASGGR